MSVLFGPEGKESKEEKVDLKPVVARQANAPLLVSLPEPGRFRNQYEYKSAEAANEAKKKGEFKEWDNGKYDPFWTYA